MRAGVTRRLYIRFRAHGRDHMRGRAPSDADRERADAAGAALHQHLQSRDRPTRMHRAMRRERGNAQACAGLESDVLRKWNRLLVGHDRVLSGRDACEPCTEKLVVTTPSWSPWTAVIPQSLRRPAHLWANAQRAR